MKLYQMTYPETGITYRLIYIDIERKIDGHLFMFGLDRGNGYERFIVDKNLQLAAERYGAVNIDEADILKEIFREKDSVIVWSSPVRVEYSKFQKMLTGGIKSLHS